MKYKTKSLNGILKKSKTIAELIENLNNLPEEFKQAELEIKIHVTRIDWDYIKEYWEDKLLLNILK